MRRSYCLQNEVWDNSHLFGSIDKKPTALGLPSYGIVLVRGHQAQNCSIRKKEQLYNSERLQAQAGGDSEASTSLFYGRIFL